MRVDVEDATITKKSVGDRIWMGVMTNHFCNAEIKLGLQETLVCYKIEVVVI